MENLPQRPRHRVSFYNSSSNGWEQSEEPEKGAKIYPIGIPWPNAALFCAENNGTEARQISCSVSGTGVCVMLVFPSFQPVGACVLCGVVEAV